MNQHEQIRKPGFSDSSCILVQCSVLELRFGAPWDDRPMSFAEKRGTCLLVRCSHIHE